MPGVIGEHLLMGSVQHALDESLLKHLKVSVLLDAENPRKRAAHAEIAPDPTIEAARVDLDYYSSKDDASSDDGGLDAFRKVIATANEVIRRAYAERKTVFVFCTHGNNESAVVCMAYLMVVEQWPLERCYRHVLQKRPASAPRKAYIDKVSWSSLPCHSRTLTTTLTSVLVRMRQLRALEREVHGRVTLRSDQVGPSMMDLMRGLQGQTQTVADDADERSSQITEGGSSTLERASIMSNVSVTTGLHNGSSLRETMVIAEREEEADDENNSSTKARDMLHHPHLHGGSHRRKRNRDQKGNCVIS